MFEIAIFINGVFLSCFALNSFLRAKKPAVNKEKISSINAKKELKMIQLKLSDLENKIKDQEISIKKLLSSGE